MPAKKSAKKEEPKMLPIIKKDNDPVKLVIKPGFLGIKPIVDSSGFKAEHRKYERTSFGRIVGIGEGTGGFVYGQRVVYDDSHAVETNLNGEPLTLINVEDIVAKEVLDQMEVKNG